MSTCSTCDQTPSWANVGLCGDCYGGTLPSERAEIECPHTCENCGVVS